MGVRVVGSVRIEMVVRWGGDGEMDCSVAVVRVGGVVGVGRVGLSVRRMRKIRIMRKRRLNLGWVTKTKTKN